MRNNLGAAKRYEKNGADLNYFEIPNARPLVLTIYVITVLFMTKPELQERGVNW